MNLGEFRKLTQSLPDDLVLDGVINIEELPAYWDGVATEVVLKYDDDGEELGISKIIRYTEGRKLVINTYSHQHDLRLSFIPKYYITPDGKVDKEYTKSKIVEIYDFSGLNGYRKAIILNSLNEAFEKYYSEYHSLQVNRALNRR